MRSSSPRRTGRAARVRSPACINRSVTDDDINSLIDGVLEESGLQMKVAHVVVPYVTVELLYRIRELVNARGSASTRKTQAVLNAVAAHACGWPHDSGGEQYNGNSMNTYIGRWDFADRLHHRRRHERGRRRLRGGELVLLADEGVTEQGRRRDYGSPRRAR